jgi:hypothetical protein
MTVRLCFALLCLLLSACATDPYSQIAQGQAALEATSIARQVNAAATEGAVSAAVLEQTRYAGEVLALQAQAEGTQAAIQASETGIALQATRAAGDLQATVSHATAETIRLQSTAGYLVQSAQMMSTSTAIVNERELAILTKKRIADRANLLRWFGALFLAGIGAVVLFGLVVWIDVIRRQALADTAYRYWRMTSDEALPRLLPPDEERREVTEFLRQAAAVVGSDSHVLPGYRVVGYNADKWTRLTDALQRVGAILKYQGKTTTIRAPYDTVGGLYQAVTTGKLRITPLPTEGAPRIWPQNSEQNRTGGQNE